jgi:DNA-directed RNA polymerase subunit K/omega
MSEDCTRWRPAWLREDATPEEIGVKFVFYRGTTKYEQAAAIGIRAGQLAQGDRPRALAASGNPLDIAAAEFHANAIKGMDVVRRLPDGTAVSRPLQDVYRKPLLQRAW